MKSFLNQKIAECEDQRLRVDRIIKAIEAAYMEFSNTTIAEIRAVIVEDLSVLGKLMAEQEQNEKFLAYCQRREEQEDLIISDVSAKKSAVSA